MNRLQSAGVFVLFLVMCLGTGVFGSLLTSPSIRSGWYESLVKPSFTPPGWVFGPVWTLLYLLMAVSAWMVWSQQGEYPVRIPLVIFFTQLVFNLLWSGIFFGSRKPGWALVEIVVLWALILLTVTLFRRVSRPAALLLIPYALWVLYAMVLNATIWWMNRGVPRLGGVVI
jgi:benzodiazapine receptor